MKINEIERELGKNGIEISLFKKYDGWICKLYKEIENPLGYKNLFLIHEVARKYNVSIEEWDMSRDDEPSYSRKAYILISEIQGLKEVDGLEKWIREQSKMILKAEKEYYQKRKNIPKKKGDDVIYIFSPP